MASQTQYKAWGKVRYSSGTEQTSYGYTGQYSYTADFGLMFYNARWYDSSLGRFAQADTIVPAGVQGYDRYGYTGNNPINYNDPSGHVRCDDEEGNCSGGSPWGNKPSQGGLPSGGDEDAEEDEYTAEELKRFWDHNNDILEFFGLYETGAIGGAAMSAAGAWATQHFGRPLMSPESISLITGVALIEPTLIAEFLVGVTIGLVIVDVGVNIIQNDLQSINNGIVNSGALQQGGSVSANSGSLQISNSNGVTTVDTTTPYIAPITLFLWSVSANGP